MSLSGYGYLFPWTMAEVRATIQASPMLLDLARGLDDCVPVPAWLPPAAHRALVAAWTTWTAGKAGWVWAISQSMELGRPSLAFAHQMHAVAHAQQHVLDPFIPLDLAVEAVDGLGRGFGG